MASSLSCSPGREVRSTCDLRNVPGLQKDDYPSLTNTTTVSNVGFSKSVGFPLDVSRTLLFLLHVLFGLICIFTYMGFANKNSQYIGVIEFMNLVGLQLWSIWSRRLEGSMDGGVAEMLDLAPNSECQ